MNWLSLIDKGLGLVQKLWSKARPKPGPDVQPIELTRVKKPNCPSCKSGYVVPVAYGERKLWTCCSCSHEWPRGEP